MTDDRETVVSLLDWFGREARDLPWRRTTDPYAIWVSEVMLQQTQVKTVEPYWGRWMKEFPDVRSLAAADEASVLRAWEGLGYYRRVRHLHAAARQIVAAHGGTLPRDAEILRALPGVGRYTAGAVGSIAFDQPLPVLDGNVARVLTRLNAMPGDPRKREAQERLWTWAQRLVDAAAATGRRRACGHLNQALMELGALVCTPQNPACDRCPVKSRCEARRLGRTAEFPESRPRLRITARHFVVVVASHRGRLCLRQRPEGDVNGGFWEFPSVEVAHGGVAARAAARRLYGAVKGTPEALVEVRHSITRYRMIQTAYRVELPVLTEKARGAGTWSRPEAWESRAVVHAHRKILVAWLAWRAANSVAPKVGLPVGQRAAVSRRRAP